MHQIILYTSFFFIVVVVVDVDWNGEAHHQNHNKKQPILLFFRNQPSQNLSFLCFLFTSKTSSTFWRKALMTVTLAFVWGEAFGDLYTSKMPNLVREHRIPKARPFGPFFQKNRKVRQTFCFPLSSISYFCGSWILCCFFPTGSPAKMGETWGLALEGGATRLRDWLHRQAAGEWMGWNGRGGKSSMGYVYIYIIYIYTYCHI